MRFRAIIFLLVVSKVASAQSIIFDDAGSADDFSYHKDGSHVICFYKTWNSDTKTSHYRTVALNANLELTDTINYKLPGDCSHLISGENDQYGYHIFLTKAQDKEVLTFLVTDKSGNVITTYEKTDEEFHAILGRKVKLRQLKFKSINTSGADAATLLLQPAYFGSGGSLRWTGGLLALNLLDGSVKWQAKTLVNFTRCVAVNGRLVTLQMNADGVYATHCYSLESGVPLAQFRVIPPDRNRVISLFEVNDSTIVVGGSDAAKSDHSNKHLRFFVTRFDLRGTRIFDKIDTVERLPDQRLQMVDGVFTPEGNIVVIGESYKIDATKVVALTAASVAIALLSGNVVIPRGSDNYIVQSVVSAKINPSGNVTEFHGFPVERRKTFSEVIKDDRQVFLRNGNQLLWYNLDDLATAPRKFTKLAPKEEVFTLYGNLIGIRMDPTKKEIVLEVIKGD